MLDVIEHLLSPETFVDRFLDSGALRTPPI